MVDFSAPFNPLISQNMAPPPNLLTQAGQALGVQGQQLQNRTLAAGADDAELANAGNHLSFVTNAMTAPLALGDKIRMKDVLAAGADAIATSRGKISPTEVTQFVSTLPPDPADPNAPNLALQQALRQHQARLLNAAQQIEVLRGQNSSINSGGQTKIITSDGFTNQPRVVGSLTNTLSPEGASAPEAGPVDPTTGQKSTISRGEFAESRGLAPTGTYTGNSGSGAIPVTIGRNGQIVRRQAGSTSAPPPGTPGGFGANTSATMPPMATEPSPAQSVALKAAGDQYSDAIRNQGTNGQQMTQLQSALSGLQSTTTGPGTESRQAIASYMLALPGGIGAYLPGVDPKSIQAYDEANKYLTQTAQGSPNATRSDAGLNTALASSPSIHISNGAAQDVLKANIGFRRAEMANTAAFVKTGLDQSQFPTWLAQRQQQVDPRAYSVDLLSQPQRQAFMSSLSPAAKTKFLGSVRDAISNGFIDPRSLQGNPSGR